MCILGWCRVGLGLTNGRFRYTVRPPPAQSQIYLWQGSYSLDKVAFRVVGRCRVRTQSVAKIWSTASQAKWPLAIESV